MDKPASCRPHRELKLADLQSIIQEVGGDLPQWHGDDADALVTLVNAIYGQTDQMVLEDEVDAAKLYPETYQQSAKSKYERIKEVREAVAVLLRELPLLAREVRATTAMMRREDGDRCRENDHLVLEAAHAALRAAVRALPPTPERPARNPEWHGVAELISDHAEEAWRSAGAKTVKAPPRIKLIERIFAIVGESKHLPAVKHGGGGAVSKHIRRRDQARRQI